LILNNKKCELFTNKNRMLTNEDPYGSDDDEEDDWGNKKLPGVHRGKDYERQKIEEIGRIKFVDKIKFLGIEMCYGRAKLEQSAFQKI
jgi:hypothetical protein